jgi:hypothetical protein
MTRPVVLVMCKNNINRSFRVRVMTFLCALLEVRALLRKRYHATSRRFNILNLRIPLQVEPKYKQRGFYPCNRGLVLSPLAP